MKTKLCNHVAELLPGISGETVAELLEIPPEETLGDFALPCFSFAKTMRKNPKVIAEDLKNALLPQSKELKVERIEAAGGYCNFFLNREEYVKDCISKLRSENLGVEQPGKGKTVCMDYSSPNIAKNFHVGHLRTTIIGNSLYKIYGKLGYNVIRINHLGDWGTQFGKLITAYRKWSSKVPALIKELETKHLLKESQGAKIIDLEAYGMPPCLISKSDGGSIYHSRDIAAILYRKQTYHFDQCLYVTGLEQSLHFQQIFKAVELMGYDWADSLMHVPYGLVSLSGAKLSTRTGTIIYAEDILREAIRRAAGAIREKNPELPDKEAVAEAVGVGAVIFHDLFHQRIKNVDFSWDKVLSFDGNTGPYVQYTYARAKSVLRKSGRPFDGAAIDYRALTDDTSYALVKVLSVYEDAVKNAAERFEPSVVARYVMTAATAFNKFYHECSILHAGETQTQARLFLTGLFQTVLSDACSLLGMKCPEAM